MRRAVVSAMAGTVAFAATVLAPASVPLANAAVSCSGSSVYENTKADAIVVPTVGSDTHNDNCELGVGNSGNAVYWLQSDLNLCYKAGLTLDSDYGPLTQAAVVKAQKAAGVTADGIYGPQTRNAILWGLASNQCARGTGF